MARLQFISGRISGWRAKTMKRQLWISTQPQLQAESVIQVLTFLQQTLIKKTLKKRESGTRTLWPAVLPPYHPKGKPLSNISSPVLLKIFWSLLGVPKMYIDVLKI